MGKPPIFLIFVTSSLLICSAANSQLPVALYIFGDSLFDPGNNNYINTTTLDQANFWPYGKSFFKYPTGRFSDGRLISDFIAEHAKLPLIPPYLEPTNERWRENNNYHGVNFASAGAGALPETFKGLVIDLRTQLSSYKKEVVHLRKKRGHAHADTILSSAIHLFSIGTNDYISPFLLNSTTLLLHPPHSQYVKMVIGNLSIVVKEIYKRGGRKFIFLNLGELGCLPGLRILNSERDGRDGCLEEASAIAKLHNTQLIKLLSRMEQHLHGFNYFLYDFNTSLTQKIVQPSLYGFSDGKKACCGIGRYNGVMSCGGTRLVKEYELCKNPKKYVFWDSYHLTEEVHKQMADQMWSSNSLKKLFQSF